MTNVLQKLQKTEARRKKGVPAMALAMALSAATLMSMQALASNSAIRTQDESFRVQYLKAQIAETVLPETCKSPYKESAKFIEFYQAALYVMAGKADVAETALVNLFAVKAMRQKMRDLFPTMPEESPLDRLIVAQLCQFERFEISRRSTVGQRVVILPTSPELHRHLSAISVRLFEDSRKLIVEALAAKARERRETIDLERHWDRVQRVEAQGQDKVKSLLNQSSF